MDLYFAGVSKELQPFNWSIGGNTLLSQLNDKKHIQNYIDNNTNPDCKLFIDSGAYSAHTVGKEIDVDNYINYINANGDKFTIFAQVDKIPGKFNCIRTFEDILNAPKESWENYKYMYYKIDKKYRHKLIPVFHQDEDFKWLKNMLEWVDTDGNHIQYIGLSCAKDKPFNQWNLWFSKCFEIIQKSSNPFVKTHAFGITAFKLLEQFPFTSCDSTAWLRDAIYGRIFTPWGRISIGIKGNQIKNEALESKIIEFVQQFNYSYEDLKSEDKLRAKFNMQYIQNWSNNIRTYKGPKDFKINYLF